MDKNSSVNIYIDSAKPFYYPGEQFLASILLDVLETINCNKMIIIAKGKQIVDATQKRSFNETEENVDNSDSDDEDEQQDIDNQKEAVTTINESNTIFKFKKIVDISNNNYLQKGKYTFPFEVELPKDIPGSFLFLQKSAYAEIIYSIKVKLDNINKKEVIPIVIRQKEEVFNYQDVSEYTKKLAGCCCNMGETKIQLKTIDKYYINGDDIKINLNIDNTKSGSTGSPTNIEIYQKLVLKHKKKKIKITKIVGNYKGKKIIDGRENYKKNIPIPLEISNYVSENLSKTKSIKYFKHKNIIPLLNQSIKSNLINNEYEIYAESQFSNLTGDELGVFINVLIYPPEKGILSKTISKISKDFSDSIVNKKIFLNNMDNDEDNEFGNNKNKKKYKNNKLEYSQDSMSEQESIKHKINKSNLKVKMIENKEKEYKDERENTDEDNNNINNINNIKKIENNYENENEINNKEKNSNNINENLNIYESQKQNNNINDKSIKKSNIMTDEISFGTSTKDNLKLFNVETTSNNIKKNFNQNFLNDPLDDEFMDLDSMK